MGSKSATQAAETSLSPIVLHVGYVESQKEMGNTDVAEQLSSMKLLAKSHDTVFGQMAMTTIPAVETTVVNRMRSSHVRGSLPNNEQ